MTTRGNKRVRPINLKDVLTMLEVCKMYYLYSSVQFNYVTTYKRSYEVELSIVLCLNMYFIAVFTSVRKSFVVIDEGKQSTSTHRTGVSRRCGAAC
ncbi:hypothetical protein JOB18_031784 [Solea senegalensis]|uniref:Uncharacterized protein n=1 Tax=Solea senegalensis TaxID=28829 RepID=A0AAV6T8R4_SOLSE|nr:hypothetical protein JOB18_031784 [Solea senegalensis]